MKLDKIDKTLIASVALHVLVLGWGLVTFQSKALEVPAEVSVGVDISVESQVKSGERTGKKENTKPKAEKVAEAKPPVEDAVGKIEDKKPPVITEAAPQEQPKPVEKPTEKKPDPPKPVVEKPKEEPKPPEPKQVEKKPEPKVDPIAEALKKEEKKPPPKPTPVAATPPPQAPKKTERVFDQSKIAALIDKRDPSRESVTGATLNSNAALGLANGQAADNSATWGSMFQDQVGRCWTRTDAGTDKQKIKLEFDVRLNKDGRLAAAPTVRSPLRTNLERSFQEGVIRAILNCQPYRLPQQFFDGQFGWNYFWPNFDNYSGL